MECKILDDTTNRVVVKLSNRNHPGLVIQGDRLSYLAMIAGSDEAFDRKMLKAELDSLLAHYTEVCRNHA